MSNLNLFDGLDRELHLVRRNRSRKLFNEIYRKTLPRVNRRACSLLSGVPSISESADYAQEGYSELWKHLSGYRWVCDCGSKFDTKRAFTDHGCCGQPRNTISQYATFILCRGMRHYQRYHTSVQKRAEWRSIAFEPMLFEQRQSGHSGHRRQMTMEGRLVVTDETTPEDHQIAKDCLEGFRDLLYFEEDRRTKFAMGELLEGASWGEIYREGVDLGLWKNYKAAVVWAVNARKNGRFDLYVGALS